MQHPAHPYYPFMLRAAQLAELGRGDTAPNPVVGALLVKEGRIVAQGLHRRYGGPHAEVAALRMAERIGVNPAECSLVVTLEPCNHQGKTPPCSEAVLRAGIRQVIVGLPDPTPAGGGADYLRARGVTVHSGIATEHCADLVEDFLFWQRSDLPYITLKLALGLDGALSDHPGKSRRLTGTLAGLRVQELRSAAQAVMVGGNTLRVDNPRLTCRLSEFSPEVAGDKVEPAGDLGGLPQLAACPLAPGAQSAARALAMSELLAFFPAAGRGWEPELARTGRQPLAVIVSGSLSGLPADSFLLQDRAAETVVLTTTRAAQSAAAEKLRAKGAAVLAPPPGLLPESADGYLSAAAMRYNLSELRRKFGCWRVLCEGGAGLGMFLLQHGLVNQLELHTAPLVALDAAAPRFAPQARLPAAGVLRLAPKRFVRLGADLISLYSTLAGSY